MAVIRNPHILLNLSKIEAEILKLNDKKKQLKPQQSTQEDQRPDKQKS